MNIDIHLQGNAAAMRLLRELGEAPEGRAIWQAVAIAESELVRQHLYRRDAKPNKMGAKKTHFYRQAGDSVGHVARRGSSEVQVKHLGVRQQWKGGTITPKESRLLTIPLRAVARGKRAAEFGDLFLLKRPRGRRYGYLARATRQKEIEVLYALMSSVEQDADASVMPTPHEMQHLAEETALLVLTRIIARNHA